MRRKWMMIGAILTMLSVAIGAFGAHMLKDKIGAGAIATYETGVQYHMIHALALLIVGLTAGRLGSSTKLKWAARLLFTGIIIFSGASTYSVYRVSKYWEQLHRSVVSLLSPAGRCLQWMYGAEARRVCNFFYCKDSKDNKSNLCRMFCIPAQVAFLV